MTFKIAVVDDESIGDLVDNINLKGLSYQHIQPHSFSQDINSISDEYDLILMDQKLAGNIGKVPYMGTTLIQELRTRMAENNLAPKPIILWSIAGNITSYQNEKSSHNLVDAVWNKEWLHHGNTKGREHCSKTIRALVSGYRNINTIICDYKSELDMNASKLAEKIFGIKTEQVDGFIPEAVIGHLINKNHHVTHTLSNFIINSVLRFNGFLIDEQTLAARLGVDIGCNDWPKLKTTLLSGCQFNGIYSDFYPRWWASGFEMWWLDNISSQHPANLEAKYRVELLNQTLNLSLIAAKPANKHYESRFWHCCAIDRIPIDEVDSFKITSSERREWQDHFYACFDAINAKRHKESGYELTQRDRERFLRTRKENTHG